jgi:hypothetical protein
MSGRQKVLIGIGVSLGATVTLIAVLWWLKIKRRGRKVRKSRARPQSQLELLVRPTVAGPDRSSDDVATTSGGGRRPSVETLPPPYVEDERLPSYTRNVTERERSALLGS